VSVIHPTLRRLARTGLALSLAGLAACAQPAPAPTPQAQPSAPVQPVPQPTGRPGEVKAALLLPLSGPNAAVGRAMQEAAQLAVFDLGEEKFTLLPRDTGGTPEGAVAAADAALADGAQIILGPLLGVEARPVGERAAARGVPVISFTNDRSVAGNNVYVFGLTPASQVDRVVELAQSRGARRFAGLIPEGAYGDAVDSALRNAVQRVGGQLVVVERYAQSGDPSPAVRRLASGGARGARGDIGFDAVLLPEFGDRLLSVSPFLPYYDIDPATVRYLGVAAWEEARFYREPSLAGAWFAAPPPEPRNVFAEKFRQLHGRTPPRIAALAYDATTLGIYLAKSGGEVSPPKLQAPQGFAGVDGLFRLRPDGTTERGLAVLEIRREGPQIVSPAPESFDRPTQ